MSTHIKKNKIEHTKKASVVRTRSGKFDLFIPSGYAGQYDSYVEAAQEAARLGAGAPDVPEQRQ